MPTLPPLPKQLLDVKIKIQSTIKSDFFDVNKDTPCSETIIKTKNLNFGPNSSLIFTSLDVNWLIIYADIITFSGPATITRKILKDLNGKNGDSAASPPPTPKGEGRNGNDGLPGFKGSDARPILRMPQVFLFARQIWWMGDHSPGPADVKGNVLLKFPGCDDGKGGDGGRGSDGTSGNRGTSAKSGWLWCDEGPGYGGRGGNGGQGVGLAMAAMAVMLPPCTCLSTRNRLVLLEHSTSTCRAGYAARMANQERLA